VERIETLPEDGAQVMSGNVASSSSQLDECLQYQTCFKTLALIKLA